MKKLICWLLALAMVLTVGGCKRNTEAETETKEPSEVVTTETEAATEPEILEVPYETEGDQRPYTGVVLELQSALASSDKEAMAVIKAAEYFETTTGAVVNIHWQEDGLDVTQADIFEVASGLLASDYLDHALDLTEMAQAADYDSWSFEALRQQVIDRCGYLAGIASVPHLTALYYDADGLELADVDAIPGNWIEFLILCKNLQEQGWAPFAMDAEYAYLATELHLEHTLGAEGLKAFIDSGWAENEDATFAVEQIGTLIGSGYLYKNMPLAYPEGFLGLATGGAMMMASSDRICKTMELDGGMSVRWGVVPWPGDGAGTGMAVDEEVLSINKNTENPQAAFDFIRLLTSGEFDQLRADLREGIPADPNNDSMIRGAVETMQKATPHEFGLLNVEFNEVYAQLWQGAYPAGNAFYKALG